MERRTGDGFMRCSDGHVRWGVYGAAGVVFVVHDMHGSPLVMLQKRSAMAHEGGNWSCAGGALDLGETAFEGALREATEEVGSPPGVPRLLGQYVFEPATDWKYTTIVVEVDTLFGSSLNFETDEVDWFPPDQVELLPLHFGFASAWPHLRAIVETPPVN
ncbi:MAG TPA: NUDIX hydrolase [Ilumatobacteraceae bacterium]|nr:NUDIX hydrolase [Ilumatobacteraceae bacterium]